MSESVDPLVKITRIPERGSYKAESINSTFDDGYLRHVAYESDHGSVVLTTLYGRHENFVYFHGSPAAEMFRRANSDVNISLAVTHVDGFVLGRSLFHHSMNYRSLVAIEKAEKVTDPEEVMHGLEVITENCLPGRWEEACKPNDVELRQTTVFRFELTEASVKVITGAP
jgi:nitroimidazol reductase NimA-like FMN-containing flavoprotein (pyridoxamine 5'-phosphate oxidase superfamily)